MLAAIPFILLLFAGFGLLLQFIAGPGQIDPQVILHERFFPPHQTQPGMDPFELVEQVLVRLTEAGRSLSLVAVPAFLWFSTRLFAGVRTALNSIYDVWVRPKPMHPIKRFLLSKLRDFVMVFMVLVLFLANTALTTGFSLLSRAFAASVTGNAIFQTLQGWLAEALGFLFLISLFFLLYRHASLRRVRWQAALVASLFAAFAFELAKRLFALYLRHASGFGVSSAGASVGAAILFVIWVYYSALVFLFGGVIAETFELRGMQRKQRG